MTGTDLLMAVADRLSKFGEARDMLIIWSDEEGRARLKSNCDYTRSLGLAAYAKADIESSLVSAEGGDTDDEGNPD
jgi:hypothetical protein